MQAVAEDFHKVDSNSIFSPQSAFKQADTGHVLILMLNYPHGVQTVTTLPSLVFYRALLLFGLERWERQIVSKC